MSNRFTGFLDSYDLFGKAIPGVAWFFGILLISPLQLKVLSPGDEAQIRGIAALLVIAILVGLIFGQGVDILARTFEESVAWTKHQIRGFWKIFRVILGKGRITIESKLTELLPDNPEQYAVGVFTILCAVGAIALTVGGLLRLSYEISVSHIILLGVFWTIAILTLLRFYDLQNIIETLDWLDDFEQISPTNRISRITRWIFNLFIDINTTVTAHRSLYAAYLEGKADTYVYPSDPNDFVYSRFESVIEPYLDVELEEFGDSEKYEYRELYPFITSHLRDRNYSRAKGFQARYSFCRSMWLTTTVFSILLFGMFFQISTLAEFSDVLGASAPQLLQTSVFAVLLLSGVLIVGWAMETILKFIGFYSDTITWVLAISYGIGLVFSEWFSEGVVPFITESLWSFLLSFLTLFRSSTETIALYCGSLLGYQDFKSILAYELLQDGIVGLAFILGISAFAFFDATGTYKRTYIEYLIAEIWISLTAENILNSSNQRSGETGSEDATGGGVDGNNSSHDGDDTDDGGTTPDSTPGEPATENPSSPSDQLVDSSDTSQDRSER
jgi:hypothetical protein